MSSAQPTEKFLRYRGRIHALHGQGGTLFLATVHPEAFSLALWRVDVDKAELSSSPLGGGATSLAADGENLYLTGTDGLVYRAPLAGGPAKPLGEALRPAPNLLAVLSKDRLAAVAESTVHILSRKDGRVLQSLLLTEPGTAIAADASGNWFVVGTKNGTLAIYDCEEKTEFLGGSTAKLHEGQVTALLFEPNELRILSAGVDNRLLLTHVRGKLEPEDRGGKALHDSPITAMVQGLGQQFYTGAGDASVKVWPWEGKGRPSTMRDHLAKVSALTIVEFKGRPHLAVGCEDGTVRLLQLDTQGKIGQAMLILRDAGAWARNESQESDPRRREVVLREIAGYKDAFAIEMLAARVLQDSDHALKVLATDLLGSMGISRAIKPLEELLKASEDAVRRSALRGLRALEGQASLRPLELALGTRHADIGVLAVEGLTELAKTDEIAFTRLLRALDDKSADVRNAALYALESLHPQDSPEADLIGLQAESESTRVLALTRLYQRGLLAAPGVAVALRRQLDDTSPAVRMAAYLISLSTRPKLATALRAKDANLQRLLTELEAKAPAAEATPAKAKKGKATKSASDSGGLEGYDLEPLLQAMASRSLDTCLRGATGLALLKDPRAFGTLLQLSREKEGFARVEAAKALQELGDPRGMSRLRLMLRDTEAQVRDAAFTALSVLEAQAPLRAAESGLQAEHEDVRRRGLQLLVQQLKKASAPAEAVDMLGRALNDTFPSVRSEAFKSVLSLKIGGNEESALRFALNSLHADVRKDVLVELMAQVTEPWAWKMLLERFHDSDAALRKEAFEFANKKATGRALEPLAAALGGRYADLKLQAAEALSKRKEKGTRDLLIQALDDEERSVRQLAIASLLAAEESGPLVQAMNSRHPDVRVRAAVARATEGDPAAFEPLMALATEKAPGPEAATGAHSEWLERVVLALHGLAELGDPRAQTAVYELLDNKEARVRAVAASALAMVSRPDTLGPLRVALLHTDEAVRIAAAFGLAFNGDPSGAALLAPKPAAKQAAKKPQANQRGGMGSLSQAEQRLRETSGVADDGTGVASPDQSLLAAFALRRHAEDAFLAFLDHSNAKVRLRALLLLLLLELGDPAAGPERLLAALSSASARSRLDAARALELLGNSAGLEQYIVEKFNDQGEGKQPWKIEASVIRSLGAVLVHGSPQVQVRAARLLVALEAEKQETFDRVWNSFSTRFASEIAAALKKQKGTRPAQVELGELVFGAYVGLSRQVGGPPEVRIRQTALARLLSAAQADASLVPAVWQVLLLSLGDANGVVRKQAFDALLTLGFEATDLAAEALAAGERDIAGAGLKLLLERGSVTDAIPALEMVLLRRTDGLQEEAAKVLADKIGWTSTWIRALEARDEAFREQAVAGLASAYEEMPEAKMALRGALTSKYRHVRSRAALELARKSDALAFDTLVQFLASDVTAEQRQAISALVSLNEARVPDALLDRLENDPAGSALRDDLLKAIGNFRKPQSAPRLMKQLENKKHRPKVFEALLTISGFDQKIQDPEDKRSSKDWEEKQHPRHVGVLASLMDALYRLAEEAPLQRLIPNARWARSGEVDAPLAALVNATKPEVRHAAVEAIGWRLRKRQGPAETLLKTLTHTDPETQFLAAEGLALAKRREGLSVLLAAVELMESLTFRQRAVRALGKLADPQSLDLLLRLVNEEGHALQEQAAEAIGHLSTSQKAEVIFRRLSDLAGGENDVAKHAMRGLRWFGTREAWQRLRERALEVQNWSLRIELAKLLGKNDDPATWDVLKRLLLDRVQNVAKEAAQSLRKLAGPDSLEPDYAFLESRHFRELDEKSMQRLLEQGDPARLLELLPKIRAHSPEEIRGRLVAGLLSRAELPVAEAAKGLAAAQEATVEASAWILGRAGKSAAKKHGAALVKTLGRLRQEWIDLDRRVRYASEEDAEGLQVLEAKAKAWQRLLWSAGRLGVGSEELLAASKLPGEGDQPRNLRTEALTALAGMGGDEAVLDVLESAALGLDAKLRPVAAAALQKLAPQRALSLVPRALDDRAVLDRLLEDEPKKALAALRPAAQNVHSQGVALPHLVAQADVVGLAEAVGNRKLADAARLGAIEALARIATEAAEVPILQLAKDEAESEELRKAAWRALRRARRYRQNPVKEKVQQ